MTGLTNEQVQERIAEGKVNVNENPNTRTYKQIILENTLTFFNFLNIALLVLVLFVRSYKNSMFMGIILINTVIGIIQEIRAKKTIDKLAILTESKTVVLREGKKWSISTEKLVLDDLIFLKTGDQVPADVKVLEGTVEVNESLLTGESDNLSKSQGDELFSGSFVTSGEACCQVIHVTLGSMVLATKKTLVQELYCIETLARVDTLCLDKTGTITEGTMKVEDVQLYDTAQTTVVQHTAKFDPETGEPVQNVSALKPEVTVSAEKENGQIQETVNLETVSQEERQKLQEIDHIMGNMMSVLHDQNATADALRKRFPSRNDLKLIHAIPFSSDRKYSGAVFEGRGTYLMGAAQFLFPEGNEELLEHCSSYAQEGYRILVLAHSEQETKGTERPTGLEPLGLFLITDVIREEAPDTLAFFDSQGVDLKVISGDDPVTVSAIAKKAGLKNANHYIDATTIKTPEEMQRAVAECSVFGRVTPQQKKQMVQALQSQKHTVAMTGDGVNDVLALKEADCSIAMAAGSDAAKNIANVVLLDSNFGAMPHIVNQGRRVVNNIRSAASMFLIKTIFSVLLSLITIFFGDAYPFEPIQMSLISACAVGIPTFLLTQENNYNKIDHTFLRHVFMNAFPAAVTITGCVFTIMLVCQDVYHSNVMLNTACVLVTGWNYMSALRTVYSPLNTYRKVIIYGMQFAFFISAVVLQDLLTLGSLEFGMIILVFVLMTFSPILIETITEWIRRIYEKSLDREDENKGFFARFLERVQK